MRLMQSRKKKVTELTFQSSELTGYCRQSSPPTTRSNYCRLGSSGLHHVNDFDSLLGGTDSTVAGMVMVIA